MVQLKSNLVKKSVPVSVGFNSCMVQLKWRDDAPIVDCIARFNSCMVQLKFITVTDPEGLVTKF